MGTLITVTEARELPVTVADARNQCRLYDDDTHDALLTRLIKVATAEIESFCNIRLVEQTLRVNMDYFECRSIELPVYPVRSISSVKYDDGDDVEQTVSTDDYQTKLDGMRVPYVRAVSGWPATYPKPDSARITFVAGYANLAAIPETLKQAVLLRVYEHWAPDEGDGMAYKLASEYRRFK